MGKRITGHDTRPKIHQHECLDRFTIPLSTGATIGRQIFIS